MKTVVSMVLLLGVCAVLAAARQATRLSGEEGRIIALESAWDQAEQNKDVNALANLLADNIAYVDYDGSISTKQELLAEVRSPDVVGEQINNEGVTVHMHGSNVVVSTGIYGTSDWKKEAFLAARALYQRLAQPKWQMGMHRQPIHADRALRRLKER